MLKGGNHAYCIFDHRFHLSLCVEVVLMTLVLITKEFIVNEKTEDTEILVDYALDMDSLQPVIVPNDKPENLGARFSTLIGEWIL